MSHMEGIIRLDHRFGDGCFRKRITYVSNTYYALVHYTTFYNFSFLCNLHSFFTVSPADGGLIGGLDALSKGSQTHFFMQFDRKKPANSPGKLPLLLAGF